MLELRELRGIDTFKMLRILGLLDIKDEVIQLIKKHKGAIKKPAILTQDFKEKKPTKAEQAKIDEAKKKYKQEQEDLGIEVMAELTQKALENAYLAEGPINEMLATLADVDVEEIEALSFSEYGSLVLKFFTKPELTDFLSSMPSLKAGAGSKSKTQSTEDTQIQE